MARPNRYPYTRSQWEEEFTLVYSGESCCFKTRVERNRITNEVKKNEKINSCFLT
jgi:hypothetical protein